MSGNNAEQSMGEARNVRLEALLKAYIALETDVQRTMAMLFSDTCAYCTSSCCTPDICEESLESAFLRHVRAKVATEVEFCDRFGWLTEKGCALPAGRPPVCYSYFCNEIVAALGENRDLVVHVLGKILSWVGEQAVGSKHLVELLDDEDINSIRIDHLVRRLEDGKTALLAVRSILGGGSVSNEERESMQRISTAQLDS